MATTRPGQPIHLVLDFDGTLTAIGTLGLFGRLAKARDTRQYLEQHPRQMDEMQIDEGHGSHDGVANGESDEPMSEENESEDNESDEPMAEGTESEESESEGTESEESEPEASEFDGHPLWRDLTIAYRDDYRADLGGHYPVVAQMKGEDEHATPEQYVTWLDSLHSVEYARAERISESGFFKGVKLEDITTVVKDALDRGHLKMCKGWNTLFEMSMPTGSTDQPPIISKLSIISVCWSRLFIWKSLYMAAERLTHLGLADKAALLNHISGIEIYANEIEGLNSPLGSTGRMTGNVRTARDKAAHMPAYSGGRAATTEKRQDQTTPLVFYAGCCATDYHCLQLADFPIFCDAETIDKHWRGYHEIFRPLCSDGWLWYDVRRWADMADRGGAPHAWCAHINGLLPLAKWLKEATYGMMRKDGGLRYSE
ncbi:hypothetical protein LTS10_006003 [Elasticomyces elasticus]|nr:hypothetical protein LTS10_006003 [Elasticomyces elasticus]